MAVRGVVTGDDVDFAVRVAIEAGSPDATIERLMAAVRDPALRGAEFSVAHAMLTVSELQLRFGKAAEAEATLRQAVADDLRDDLGEPRAYLAAYLADVGRKEEAQREFATLAEHGRAGAQEHEIYGEALEAAGDQEAAVPIYTAGEQLAEDAGDSATAVRLRKSANRARGGGVARVTTGRSGAGASVLVWRKTDHARAVATWPMLKDDLGTDWDEHRAMVERALARAEEPTYAVADFVAFSASTRGLPPVGTTLSAYLRAAPVAGTWPPEHGSACWCGSGHKYKRCCRPRGLAAVPELR